MKEKSGRISFAICYQSCTKLKIKSTMKLQKSVPQFACCRLPVILFFLNRKNTSQHFLKTFVIFLFCVKNNLCKFQTIAMDCSPLIKWNRSQDSKIPHMRYAFLQFHYQNEFFRANTLYVFKTQWFWEVDNTNGIKFYWSKWLTLRQDAILLRKKWQLNKKTNKIYSSSLQNVDTIKLSEVNN